MLERAIPAGIAALDALFSIYKNCGKGDRACMMPLSISGQELANNSAIS